MHWQFVKIIELNLCPCVVANIICLVGHILLVICAIPGVIEKR